MHLIHAPEIHFSPSKAKECLHALEIIYNTCASLKDKAYVFFTGDLYDHAMQNTDKSGFTALHKSLERISSVSTVIYQYGTRSQHDIEGSYEVLKINGRSIVLDMKNRTWSDDSISVFSFEEPQLSEFKGSSVEEIWTEIKAHEKLLCVMATDFFSKHPNTKHVLMGHGTVLCEATMNNPAITFGNYHITDDDLAGTHADIALWGHLHQPYKFSNIKGGYARSLAHNYKDCGFLPGFSVYDNDLNENVIRLSELPVRFSISVNIPDEGDPIIETNKHASAFLASGEKVKIRPDVSIPHEINDSLHRNQITELILSKYPSVILDASRVIERSDSKVRNADISNDISYRSLCKKVYPDWSEEDLQEMDKLEAEDIKEGIIPVKKEISIRSITARGYIPFRNGIGSEEFKIEFDKFGRCVLGLIAPGGYGKSSAGDLFFPHPECLSQPEDKKNLFFLEDSYIMQEFDVDGHKVECKIIGGPEGKGAAFFCYVDGAEKCKKGVREYKEVINSIFGTVHEFALVMSRTQFKFARNIDGQNCNPDIKYAANKEMKDLYAPLCGSDKTKTMLRCKARSDEYKKTSERVENEITGIQSSIDNLVGSVGDVEALSNELKQKETVLEVIREEIDLIVSKGKESAAGIELAKESARKNEAEKDKRRADGVKMNELVVKAEDCSFKISSLRAMAYKLESNKKLIALDDSRIERNKEIEAARIAEATIKNGYAAALNEWNRKLGEARATVSARNNAKMAEFRSASSISISRHSEESKKYNADLSEWMNELETLRASIRNWNENSSKEYSDALSEYKKNKQSLEMMIEELNKKIEINSSSCPNCGYISPESSSIISECTSKIACSKIELSAMAEPAKPEVLTVPETLERAKPVKPAEYVALEEPELEPLPESIGDPKPEEPEYKTVGDIENSSIDRSSVLKEIEEASGASSSISTLEELKSSLNSQIDELQSRKYDIDVNIDEKLRSLEAVKLDLENAYRAKTASLRMIESEISEINKKMAAVKQVEESLNALKGNLSLKVMEKQDAETLHLRWKKYQAAWDRNGIPARFVELAAPMIDAVANEILSQFYPDMFIETCTTKEDAKGETADTFEVWVFNTKEGSKQKLSSLSGEQTNFVLSAMFFAFRKKYEENTGRKINFVFEDEQDDHVSLIMQPSYWNMVHYQQQLENKLRVCTSHSAEFPNRIENVIDLEEMK